MMLGTKQGNEDRIRHGKKTNITTKLGTALKMFDSQKFGSTGD